MIVEFGGKYLMWSSRCDSPYTHLMTRDELEVHVLEESGTDGLADLPRRMARVGKTGTSSLHGITKADLLASNRAGENETRIGTEAEMIERYSYGVDLHGVSWNNKNLLSPKIGSTIAGSNPAACELLFFPRKA